MIESVAHDVRLLVVDDRPENLYSFRRVLEREPYEIDVAETADDALRLMLRNEYACVLCDVQMPDVDGFELAKIVRADPVIRNTPIIFITAHDSSADQIYRAFDVGAYDFISKPVDPTVLRGKLRIFSLLHTKTMEIERQKQSFQAMIENMAEGLAVVARDGQLVYSNDQLSEFLGSSPDRTDFRGWFGRLGFMEPEMEHALPPARLALERAFEGERVIDQELYLPPREHRPGTYVAITSSSMGSGETGSADVVLFVRDVSDRKRNELTIRGKNRDLEQFAYVASHDLKAPLRHITAFADILMEELGPERSTEEVTRALSVIRAGTREMRQLIDGLLLLSKAGKESMQIEPLKLDELIRESWSSVSSSDSDADGELVITGELPVVFGDHDRIKQVLQNLTTNAVKFASPKRRMRIEVSADDCRERWRIFFKDNGIGIDEKYRERVFQIFQRLHPKHQYEGSGIGLSICKKILEMHDGHISFESDGSSGTTFVIDLPKRPRRGSQ